MVPFTEVPFWYMFSTHGKTSQEALRPLGYFPLAPAWRLPAGAKQHGNSASDVWSARLELPKAGGEVAKAVGVQGEADESERLAESRNRALGNS